MLEAINGPWDYKVQPNKLLELVKNIGNMEQAGTGYYVESESEMLTILAYLNYGETTNITEAMMAQIDQAVKQLESKHLHKGDEDEYESGPKLGQEENYTGPKLGEGDYYDGPSLGLDGII